MKDRKRVLRPGQGSPRRLAQKHFGKRVDESALFRERHEDGRRDIAEVGVAPPRQRLETHRDGRSQIDDRLKVDIDPTGDDRIAQCLLKLRRVLHLLCDLLRIDGDLSAAAPFGAVERGIGALQQVVERVSGKGIGQQPERGESRTFRSRVRRAKRALL